MYVDSQLLFSDAQAITADAVGTNVIDLSQDRSIGGGEAMCVMFSVDVAADQTSSDEDYTFEVEYSSDAAQTTARKRVGFTAYQSGTPAAPTLNADLLVAGYKFFLPIPPGPLSISERFLGIRYDVTGTSPTITCTAVLMPMSMVDADAVYVDGFTIQ